MLNILFPAMWIAWAVYWWSPSHSLKATARRESTYSRLSYIAPMLLAVILLFSPTLPITFLETRFLPLAQWRVWGAIGVAVNLAGLLFAVWARLHLGRNWSGTITLKQDHELVTSGPYAVVRHPIYTGLLLGFSGVAIARGEWRCILGVVIMALAFWRKLRIEERWMLEQFGDAYRSYRQRVAALIPGVRRVYPPT
jgi:protein-S-isoprenylcysteine O-methyltransferase Ste14